jgi:Coenzyme PQQ synthesis protein D (PqqD)
MDTNTLERLKDLAISESGFLFDPYSGATFTLNNTGKFIIQLLMEGKVIEQIESALRKRFEIGDEDLRSDIYEFVNLLKENHFLPNGFTP